jgi:hypothetical protein
MFDLRARVFSRARSGEPHYHIQIFWKALDDADKFRVTAIPPRRA